MLQFMGRDLYFGVLNQACSNNWDGAAHAVYTEQSEYGRTAVSPYSCQQRC